MYACMHACMHVRMYACVHACVRVGACVYVCTDGCACMYVCWCVDGYIYYPAACTMIDAQHAAMISIAHCFHACMHESIHGH
jgi:hypothetical protein